jgi:hypothetical chaperone protein
MDFGTTNSGMALYDGHSVNVLPLDPHNANPRVARTSLYVNNDQAVTIGRKAIDHYFQQNIGRAVKMQRVWIGELEILGGDMYYVTDAYAFVDVFSPGRLFLSMKTGLRDADYPGTVVGQFYYPLEDLIALYMTATKARAEKLLGHELRQVVLGRPVRFSTDSQQDSLAESRLLQAAFRAGYEKVFLQHEPVAAAFSYEMSMEREQHVLVFDFGGGTLDITVMRLGDPARRQVMATGGIPVAGDLFDQKLVRTKLPRHFGEGSRYGPRHKALTVPRWIYDTFANWQTILELQSTENGRILQEIAQTAQRRYQIEALISLVSNNYGLPMFDQVERAKRRLSEKRGAEILLEGPGFKVREFVTRTEFENIIHAELTAIEQHLDETVKASGLSLDEIDVVIRTGGSSQIPVFHEMLKRKFGPDKVQRVDTFSSVTAGLGIIAHGIESGSIEAEGVSPEDVLAAKEPHSRPNVSLVNLEMVQRRILADENATGPESKEPQFGLVTLGEDGFVSAVLLRQSTIGKADSFSLHETSRTGSETRAMTADLDERLLLITSSYRFLLATARQLADLANVGLSITDLHQLEPFEKVCAISRWEYLKQHAKLLLVTSSGYTRTYPMNVLKTNVEAPVPMRFDQPLPGVVVAALGARGDEQLVIATRSGRAGRLSVRMVRTSGFQALNCGDEDRVTGAALARPEDELLLVNSDGYARRLLVDWIPLSTKANVKGKSLVARRSDTVVAARATEGTPLWLMSSKAIKRIDAKKVPLTDSTKTQRLLRLEKLESVWAQVDGFLS